MNARTLLGTTFLTLGLAGSAAAAGTAGNMAPGGRTVAGPASLHMAATTTERVFTDPTNANVCATVAVLGKSGSVTMTLTGLTTPSAVVAPGGSKSLCVESVQFVDLDCGATSSCDVQWRVDRN